MHLNLDDQTYRMQARTQNVTQDMFTKPIPWQRRHKMYVKLILFKPSHASKEKKKLYQFVITKHDSEETRLISTCVDQTPTMPAKKENVSKLVMTKPIPC